MYRILLSLLITALLLTLSCSSYELHEPQKYDYSTSGVLTDDCFQVIITMPPDKELRTMSEQRENAYIKAKNSISQETARQIMNYYTANIPGGKVSDDMVPVLEKKFEVYSRHGVIDQEFYLIDNSAVLIFRIYKTGIKKEILNN